MIALGYALDARGRGRHPGPARLHAPTAIEGLDRRIVEVVRRTRGEGAVPPLPRGDGWVFVELVGDDPGELAARAARAARRRPAAWTARWSPTRRRRSRCGRSARTAPVWPGSSLADPAYPGWEDAAVPPAKLGAYLRDFDALLDSYGLHGLPYGHFGDGCVHVRIDFPLTSDGRRCPLPVLRGGRGPAGGRLRRVDVG